MIIVHLSVDSSSLRLQNKACYTHTHTHTVRHTCMQTHSHTHKVSSLCGVICHFHRCNYLPFYLYNYLMLNQQHGCVISFNTSYLNTDEHYIIIIRIIISRETNSIVLLHLYFEHLNTGTVCNCRTVLFLLFYEDNSHTFISSYQSIIGIGFL